MPSPTSIFSIVPTVCLSLSSLAAGAVPDFKRDIEPVLSQYCYDCHADGVAKGDFAMDDYKSLDEHLADMPLWLRVWDLSLIHI